jgi:DNA-binding transcriptional LysR family regulator
LSITRQGFGFSFLPEKMAGIYPELESLWPDLAPVQVESWLVTHRELRTNPGIRLVFDLLAEGIG